MQANNLAGHYTYAGAEHSLEVSGVDLADGHYSAKVKLQGPAPMAIDAVLDGRVKAPLGEGRSLDVLANAKVTGNAGRRRCTSCRSRPNSSLPTTARPNPCRPSCRPKSRHGNRNPW